MTIILQSNSQAGDPAFVSGSIANLATNGVATIVFDLGQDRWRNLRSAVVSGANLATSNGGAVTAVFSSDASGTNAVRAMTPNNTSGGINYTNDLATLVFQLLVTDRFLRVLFINGSTNAQPANALIRVAGHDQ